jgi:hypothetical protein
VVTIEARRFNVLITVWMHGLVCYFLYSDVFIRVEWRAVMPPVMLRR